jgi:penicillin amidase
MAAPPGQSGFIAPDGTKSPHYSDQLELYTNFECKQENLFPAQVEANLESVTTLR